MPQLRRWLLLPCVLLVVVGANLASPSRELASDDTLPRYLVQIGEPRTATSLQFATVCAAVAAKFMDDPEVEIECGFKLWDQIPNHNKHKYVVTKAHSIDDAHTKMGLTRLRQHPSLVFMTARNHSKTATADALEREYGLEVAYTAVTTDVIRDGYKVGHDEYKRIFGLTDQQAQYVLEWLRLWSTIRVCCGAQMSQSWRKELAPNSSVACTSFSSPGSKHSSSIDTCSSLNISAVEHQLMQTYLYQAMHKRVPLLGKASKRDGDLTGTYCETCNENVRGLCIESLACNCMCIRDTFLSERGGI